MRTEEHFEIHDKLLRASSRLKKVAEGWNVTYETPEETRKWISRLQAEALSAARTMEAAQEFLIQ